MWHTTDGLGQSEEATPLQLAHHHPAPNHRQQKPLVSRIAMQDKSSIFALAYLLFLTSSFPSSSQALNLKPYNSNAPKVWLTVSSLVEKVRVNGKKIIRQRKLELNWMNLPIAGQDSTVDDMTGAQSGNIWVAMFDKDQTDPNSDDALVSLQPKGVTKGRFRSEIEFPVHIFTPANLSSQCLGFWILAFDETHIIAKNCIKAQPFWMRDLMPVIKDRSVKDIMIPGTHNAGSYEVAGESSRSDGRSILKKYVTCQDESVFNQLAYGIRYLDLRVSYESVVKRPERLWIVHGILRTETTLESLLKQVRFFLDATTDEVVILDFHRFERGFEDRPRDMETNLATKARHQEVFNLIESILGPHISRDSSGFHVKVGHLVQSEKRAIIGYAATRFIREAKYYPRVRHLWAEAENTTTLENYFNRMICVTSGFEATSAMAQLTPSTWGVIFDKYDGLRKMAQDVNWLVSQWFEERWWPCVNIVATDFFLGNNLIDISIHANSRRPDVPNRRFRRSDDLMRQQISHRSESLDMDFDEVLDGRKSLWD